MGALRKNGVWVVIGLVLSGCKQPDPEPAPLTDSAAPSEPLASAEVAHTVPSAAPPAQPEPTPTAARYAWLGNPELKFPAASGSLAERFPPPPSYTRVPAAAGSFAAWLRGLPLAAPGTAVVNFKGEELVPADHQYLGAVVAMDVGTTDLQTSSDIVLRLNAEWKFAENKPIEFKAATGLEMPFERWVQGDRLKAVGPSVAWIRNARPGEKNHQALRAFLDGVYTWANSTSVIATTKSVPAAEIEPGDFLIHQGKPSHAVVLLDIAKNSAGKLVALLGRSLNPAQSFHVLRLGLGETWYNIDPQSDYLLTPGTDPFPWGNVRRMN